MQMVAAY